MSRRTAKAGPIARYGPRYGVRIRRRALDVEIGLRQRHVCPRCQARGVTRASTGVWRCRHCGLVFAGGAYRPVVTTVVRREIAPEAAPTGAEAKVPEEGT